MTQDHQNTPENTEDTPELELDLEQATAEIADADAIAALEAQVAQWKDQAMRAHAEMDNLRKRFEREKEQALKYGSERLLKDLLPVLDSLALGIDAARQSEDACMQQFTEGSEMTLKLLIDTLGKHGIEELNPVGEKFNPEFHEAVTALPNAEVEPNTVLHVAQKGYVLNGRSIRAAQVVVSRAP
ncbi:MAG: nucleotide exchange factor GrpE [Cardiobacteriaceae bacterium]|nr:nucleotide exchange factor GrpE [Cardiobacteriaceae bacterium]